MPDSMTFQYQPECSHSGCPNLAKFKVAASWSDGTSHELKNYGVACEAHRDEMYVRATQHRLALALAEGEVVGPVGVYELTPGRRDRDLLRM